MNDSYTGAVVVIPTRNRSTLAMNAIRSVLNHGDENINVLVSDNSTSVQDADELFQFCQKTKDTRVDYITPPKLMSMTVHWEWAIQQALRLYDVSHFIYLSDRAVFISDGLKQILHYAKTFPDKVISYNFDVVDDTQNPVLLLQNDWTGQLYEIESWHLLYLVSQLKIKACLPRMLNCIVPRSVLQNIHKRFGSIFDSIAPDYCFAFRCLEIVDSIIYYDQRAIIGYAHKRSNGWSFATGIMNEARIDFEANLARNVMFFATPIPELCISTNSIIHEYCIVKDQTKSVNFLELDKSKYLSAMSKELELIRNPDFKHDMIKVLEAHGWRNSQFACNHACIDGISSSPKANYLSQKIRYLLRNPYIKPLWFLLSRLFGIYPSGVAFEFRSTEEAIKYANRFPRRRCFRIEGIMEDLEMANIRTL